MARQLAVAAVAVVLIVAAMVVLALLFTFADQAETAPSSCWTLPGRHRPEDVCR